MNDPSNEDVFKIANAVDSLSQQVTVISVSVGVMLKAISKIDTAEADEIRSDLAAMSKALEPLIVDKRAKELMQLILRSANGGET